MLTTFSETVGGQVRQVLLYITNRFHQILIDLKFHPYFEFIKYKK